MFGIDEMKEDIEYLMNQVGKRHASPWFFHGFLEKKKLILRVEELEEMVNLLADNAGMEFRDVPKKEGHIVLRKKPKKRRK